MIGKRLLPYLALAATLVGCGGSTTGTDSFGQAIVLLTGGTSIQRVRLSNGDFIGNNITINVEMTCIAVDNTTGELYGFGEDTKLYSIHPITGQCTAISAAPTNLDDNGNGMAVDPATGNIRYVNASNQNAIISTASGTVIATNTNFAFETGDPNQGDDPNLVGCAFRPASSALYALDGAGDLLVRAPAPANGELETVGSTSVNFSGDLGFAIDPETSFGYAVSDGVNNGLFRIDLDTGQATPIRTGVNIEDIIIVP